METLIVTHKQGVSAFKEIQQMPAGTYKQPAYGVTLKDARSVCCVTPSHLYVSCKEAPVILQYCYHQETPVQKSFYAASGKSEVGFVTDMRCSDVYLVAGTSGGYLMIWNHLDGTLLKKVHAHYGQVTSILVLKDTIVTSGGQGDAMIHHWSLKFDFGEFKPMSTRSDHTAGVSQLVQVDSQRYLSCSLDKTVKLFDLEQCLFTLVMPVELCSVAIDFAESFIACGGSDGQIYIQSLLNDDADQIQHFIQHANVLAGHKQKISSVVLSMDASKLYSSDVEGVIHIWDIATRQLIHTVTSFQTLKSEIYSLQVIPRPRNLFQKQLPQTQSSLKRHAENVVPLHKNIAATLEQQRSSNIKAFIK